jgi:hypothetical protein
VTSEKPRFPKGMPPRWRHDDWANAYRCADHLARSFCVPYSRAETQQYLRWLYRRAKALIHHEPHWEAVRSLMRALRANQKLGKEETLAAYKDGLAAWRRNAHELIEDYNLWHSPRIPHGHLSLEQLLELLPLTTAVDSRWWHIRSSEGSMEERANAWKRLDKAKRALLRHLKTLESGNDGQATYATL